MTATFSAGVDAHGQELDGEAVARLRAALIAERLAQAALVEEYEFTVAELTGQADVDSLLERHLASASAGRARDVIDDIDTALSRLETGSYGVCESCGAPIPGERLEAIPHARRCVSCLAGRS